MESLIHIQKTFEKVVYIDKKINNREFEDCVFKNCDFSNSNFAYNTFLDCEFIDCNLSMTSLFGTNLKNVSFKNCKLLGIAFNECDDFLFQVCFEESTLDYAIFSNKKMPKTKFINCSVREVTFIGTNLTSSVFDNCNSPVAGTMAVYKLANELIILVVVPRILITATPLPSDQRSHKLSIPITGD